MLIGQNTILIYIIVDNFRGGDNGIILVIFTVDCRTPRFNLQIIKLSGKHDGNSSPIP